MAGEFTLVNNVKSTLADTAETVYTAGQATLITAVTATNNTGINRSFRMYIENEDGTTEAISPYKMVTSLRGFDLAPAMVGHTVPKDGTIKIESSAADTLQFRVTGRYV